MEAKDLRIGNYISAEIYNPDTDKKERVICQVEVIDSVGLTDHKLWLRSGYDVEEYTDVKPIPLTEDWLLKFGFEKEENKVNNRWSDGFFQLEIQGNKYAYYLWGGEDAPHLTQFIGHCEYFHQLQNLYHALTGQELTINQK